jgi:hypothetical protein
MAEGRQQEAFEEADLVVSLGCVSVRRGYPPKSVVAACYSAACRPPTSGGTGGSLPSPKATALYGRGIDALFTGPSPTTVNPFPSAKRTKSDPSYYDTEHVKRELAKPVELSDTDPRILSSMQNGLTREGVRFYMESKEYFETGRTYADRDKVSNQYPIVYHKRSTGESILLAGNHRAVAALLQGRTFKARHIESP